MTFQEIKERAADGWLAVVPTGCTEQQGPHLPVDFDTWYVETVCLAAAETAAKIHGVNALVLPALPFGPTPEHRNFGSGYVDVPQSTHESIVTAILVSLAAQGFRRLVIWRGCGQHALDAVVDRFNAEYSHQCQVFNPDLPYHSIWCQNADGAIPGGHADSFATSIALYLRPSSVRVELISDPQNDPVDWLDPHLDFSRYSTSGVIGNPTFASAELGETLWTATTNHIALVLRDIANG
ncbi:MAG: creatininase family protein [Anaerolineae bacterium]|nr:creatininase family protein [Anaerolineae bacterium]